MPEKDLIEKPGKVEKVIGHPGTNVVATLVAASSSFVGAALLPLLTGTLAFSRFRKRVESAIEYLDVQLSSMQNQVNDMSDTQFQFLNEAVATILHTTDEEKFEYLTTAAVRAIGSEDLEEHETTVLSRALRDISVVEIRFLLQIDRYDMIILTSTEPGEDQAEDETKLFIDPNEGSAAYIAGLQTLGLVVPLGSGYGGTLNCRVLPVAKRLAALVRVES